MKNANTPKPMGTGKPKARLSPDLAEVLHMLKSLEAELDGDVTPAR
jgi:hypothetical protein